MPTGTSDECHGTPPSARKHNISERRSISQDKNGRRLRLGSGGLGGRGFFRLLFQAGIAAGKLALELFNAAGSVNEFQFARVKRMANVANIDLELRHSAAGGERVSATALDHGGHVFGMNVFLHSRPSWRGSGRRTNAA